MSQTDRKQLKRSVFIPAFVIIMLAVIIGLVNNELLVSVARQLFYLSLSDFGWLYQLLAISTLGVTAFIFFPRQAISVWVGRTQNPRFRWRRPLPWR
ncbi:hypothetical protein HORIV_23550 [Vreelandella olivaria]|uniref:Uncharacterized protein n=1 Tax=Vreelandella olivaria TaxID=390919 RepID=A0ABN5WSJ4_9GAMM|nr:hypothetical protein HORIV_23550 [Halomonas olivaria]